MNSIDLNLTKEELEYIKEAISRMLNQYSEAPEVALPLIELMKYKLDILNQPKKEIKKSFCKCGHELFLDWCENCYPKPPYR